MGLSHSHTRKPFRVTMGNPIEQTGIFDNFINNPDVPHPFAIMTYTFKTVFNKRNFINSRYGSEYAADHEFQTAPNKVQFLISINSRGEITTTSGLPFFKLTTNGSTITASSMVPQSTYASFALLHSGLDVENDQQGIFDSEFFLVGIYPEEISVEYYNTDVNSSAPNKLSYRFSNQKFPWESIVIYSNLVNPHGKGDKGVPDMSGVESAENQYRALQSQARIMDTLENILNEADIVYKLQNMYSSILTKFDNIDALEDSGIKQAFNNYLNAGDINVKIIASNKTTMAFGGILYPQKFAEVKKGSISFDEIFKEISAEIEEEAAQIQEQVELDKENPPLNYTAVQTVATTIAGDMIKENGDLMEAEFKSKFEDLNLLLEMAKTELDGSLTSQRDQFGMEMNKHSMYKDQLASNQNYFNTLLTEQEGTQSALTNNHNILNSNQKTLVAGQSAMNTRQKKLIDEQLVFDGTLVKHEGVQQALTDRAASGEYATSNVHQAAVRGHKILADDVIGLTTDLGDHAAMRAAEHERLQKKVEMENAARIKEANLQKEELSSEIKGQSAAIKDVETDINKQLKALDNVYITGATLQPVIDSIEKQLDHLQEEIAYEGEILEEHIIGFAKLRNYIESIKEKISGIPTLEEDITIIQNALNDIELQVVTGFDMGVEHYNIEEIHQVHEPEPEPVPKSKGLSFLDMLVIVMIIIIAVVLMYVGYKYQRGELNKIF